MTTKQRKRLVLIVIAGLVLLLVVYGFLPDPVPVEVARVRYDAMQVIVEEEGETRVDDRFVISSPVAAYARRVELDAGDYVQRGQEVVRLEPPRSTLLDPRARAEAQARVAAAEAALRQAERNVEGAEAAADRAVEERRRVERLFEAGSATQQRVELAVAEAVQAAAAVEGARAAVVAARADLAAARAALEVDTAAAAELPVQELLRSPVAGRVLTVRHESEGLVAPGEPLIEIGDTGHLEVRVDVLSQDAVRIRPGMRVLFDQWGGDAVLEGIVERVEPQGFTRVSSLGVEEKRVTVVAGITTPPEVWAPLGAGYRVLARFVIWDDARVLQVPTSALFRTDEGWAVFVVEDGVALRRTVEVGHQTGLAAQIVSGLEEGDAVIVHPDTAIEEGTRVEYRERAEGGW